MMNYLIIGLVLFYLIRSKNESVNDLLKSISLEDALPLLQAFGVSENTLQLLTNLLPSFLEGNLDLPSLIKTLLPLFSTLNLSSAQKKPDENFEGLCAVEDFAPKEIVDNMRDYFAIN